MKQLPHWTSLSGLALAMVSLLATAACRHTPVFHPLAAPTMTHNRSEIPDKYKWDVAPIFANWAAWEDGMKALEAKMREYAALKGSLAQRPQAVLYAY
jgi:hypothetical protein